MPNQRTPRPAIIEGDVAKLPLGIDAKDGYAIVDKKDAWLEAYKWSVGGNGYPATNILGKRVNLHSVLLLPLRSQYDTRLGDHINGDKLDNRRSNLRLVDRQQNNTNRSSNKVATSKYRGVFWHKSANQWCAKIGKDKKYEYLGYFKTEEEAAHAYNEAALRLHGNYKRLNVIGG